jgi:hypothetical protein
MLRSTATMNAYFLVTFDANETKYRTISSFCLTIPSDRIMRGDTLLTGWDLVMRLFSCVAIVAGMLVLFMSQAFAVHQLPQPAPAPLLGA